MVVSLGAARSPQGGSMSDDEAMTTELMGGEGEDHVRSDGAGRGAPALAPPATSYKHRRHRRTRPRGTTIAMKRISMAELQLGAALYPRTAVDLERPRTRGDCGAEARPCPWVACKHHL